MWCIIRSAEQNVYCGYWGKKMIKNASFWINDYFISELYDGLIIIRLLIWYTWFLISNYSNIKNKLLTYTIYYLFIYTIFYDFQWFLSGLFDRTFLHFAKKSFAWVSLKGNLSLEWFYIAIDRLKEYAICWTFVSDWDDVVLAKGQRKMFQWYFASKTFFFAVSANRYWQSVV